MTLRDCEEALALVSSLSSLGTNRSGPIGSLQVIAALTLGWMKPGICRDRSMVVYVAVAVLYYLHLDTNWEARATIIDSSDKYEAYLRESRRHLSSKKVERFNFSGPQSPRHDDLQNGIAEDKDEWWTSARDGFTVKESVCGVLSDTLNTNE